MPKQFDIIVIGAGLAGLGAAIALKKKGHNVTVLEAAAQLNEVGAGIQTPPNSTRVLFGYGLEEKLLEKASRPDGVTIRRWENGEVLSSTPVNPTMREKYGYPIWFLHRADYQNILYEGAKEAGVKVMLGCPIESIDEIGPSVTLQTGQCLKADVIVGADGIRSKTRKSILKNHDIQVTEAQQVAYRATVPAHVMRSDPETSHLMDVHDATIWIGPEKHLVGYVIRGAELYNIVCPHPGHASVGKWNEEGSLDDLRNNYSGWDPTVQKLLQHVTEASKWKLAYLPPLPRWTSENGRVVLIGDAAHAMLPYLSQGAAVAIEDGAALAECLDRANSMADIPVVLSLFEKIRKPRCETISLSAQNNGRVWHLPDGEQQQQRDRKMRGELKQETPRDWKAQDFQSEGNKLGHKDFQPWLFGYDTVKETNDFLDANMG